MISPGMKLGPFVIEAEIGSGAMGAVYRAQYRDKPLRVAVKVMAPGVGTGEVAQARFQREADILKNLQHPNIVRLLAVGQFKTAPFYAMEYIQGETLEAHLERRDRLSWEEVVRIGRQLCDALQHAHDKEVIHRDLKPGNIMMLPDGTVKLTDFGIAKALDMTGLTATNCTVGTAAYMSPEQCKGDPNLSHKSDLYSMGILFYELVTGRKPFVAESTMDMFLQHVKGAYQRPSVFVPDIPVWLDNLICQLLEKSPADRPVSARLVGETLAQIEEKVQAQMSAGLERVTARTREKAEHRPRMTEGDHEAALTLVGKKKKKKKVPFYQQGWFTVLALLVVLSAMGAGIYYVFFVPPSLDALAQQTRQILDAGDHYENWMRARDEPLRDFHRYYADAAGDTADRMREWSDDVNAKIADHQLLARLYNKIPADGKGEKSARFALDLEDQGQLTRAMEEWSALTRRQLKDTDPDKRAWALVGKLRLSQLKQLEVQYLALKKKVARNASFQDAAPEERLAAEAIRAETVEQKADAAKEAWERLKKKTADDEEARGWFLLAAWRLNELNKKPKTE